MKKILAFFRWLLLILFVGVGLTLLTTGGASLISLNEKGNEAFARGAYDEALAAYRAVMEKNPNLPQPYFNAAGVFYRRGDLAAAQDYLQKALALSADPELTQHIFYNLGNVYFQSLQFDAAVQAYIQALLLDPGDVDARHNLELTLSLMQQAPPQERPQQTPPDDPAPQEKPPEQPQDMELNQSFDEQQVFSEAGQQLTEMQARELLRRLEGAGETLQDHIGTFRAGGDNRAEQDW
ncbi:MAG: tetratricopeptide repeat protein [Caldilineae bacterium]|nr:MAG: tetratricopeptide repeat protein [Caldilineae bacterium]